MRSNSKHSRGVSLVEAMVALAVMAFGMLAVVGVQSTLRLNADVAKQRSEATRIAQETLERYRSFTSVDTGPAEQTWNGIAEGTTTVRGLNAVYEVRRDLLATPDAAKVLSVTVSWADRASPDASANQHVTMASTIAAAAPALSGTLAVRPGIASVAPVRRPFRRHPSIPVQAKDLGSSSAFVPPQHPQMAIVFNNVTGVVTGICNFNYETASENILPEEIADCSNTMTGQLLSGFVRFQRREDGADLVAGDVEDPPGPALNMRITLSLTSTGHPSGSFCIDDANSTSVSFGNLAFATYYCVIVSNSTGLWSGTTTVTPRNSFGSDDWQISDTPLGASPGNAGNFRVCRYTSASNDAQTVPSEDHPRNYSGVSGNLTNQNFVVIRSVKHCPTDTTANPEAGDLVNTNTLQHQPAPSS
jgi:Tfp pilus assembly protein PilV